MFPIIYGISSALAWGAADFIGGIASKRTNAIRILYLAELASFIPFIILAVLLHEPLPPAADLVIGAAASILGLVGLVFLYRALAGGQMTIAAPVSALFAALLPVIFGLFTLGFPSTSTIIGFGFAFLAVSFISQTDSTNWRFSISDLRLPLLSGFFFGFYFIAIHKATLNAFFWPLAVARFAGFLALGLYSLITRQPSMPPREIWTLCIVNGVIDIAGNAFYVLSAHTGRIDVAAVLGALYPASTVLLAWIFLKERISLIQAVGIAFAFIAIILFTL